MRCDFFFLVLYDLEKYVQADWQFLLTTALLRPGKIVKILFINWLGENMHVSNFFFNELYGRKWLRKCAKNNKILKYPSCPLRAQTESRGKSWRAFPNYEYFRSPHLHNSVTYTIYFYTCFCPTHWSKCIC